MDGLVIAIFLVSLTIGFILISRYVNSSRMSKRDSLLAESNANGYKKSSPTSDVLQLNTEAYICLVRREYNPKRRNQPILVSALIVRELPDFFGIQFGTESSWLTKLSGIFGITDVRSGDSSFDERVAVNCPSRTFAQTFLLKPLVRELVLKIHQAGFTSINIGKRGIEASTNKGAILNDNNPDFSVIAENLYELLNEVSSDYKLLTREAGAVKSIARRLILGFVAVIFPLVIIYAVDFAPYTPVNSSELSSLSWYLTTFIFITALAKTLPTIRQGSGYHKIFPLVALGGLITAWFLAQACLVYVNGIFDSSTEQIKSSSLVRVEQYRRNKRTKWRCYISGWEPGQLEYRISGCTDIRKYPLGTEITLGTKSGFLGAKWFSSHPRVKE
jgi:hypothetical protein